MKEYKRKTKKQSQIFVIVSLFQELILVAAVDLFIHVF